MIHTISKTSKGNMVVYSNLQKFLNLWIVHQVRTYSMF